MDTSIKLLTTNKEVNLDSTTDHKKVRVDFLKVIKKNITSRSSLLKTKTNRLLQNLTEKYRT